MGVPVNGHCASEFQKLKSEPRTRGVGQRDVLSVGLIFALPTWPVMRHDAWVAAELKTRLLTLTDLGYAAAALMNPRVASDSQDHLGCPFRLMSRTFEERRLWVQS